MRLPFVRNTILLASAFAVLLFIGCSGASPSTPPEKITHQRDRASYDGERLLMGQWHIDINPSTSEMKVLPLRRADIHLNATALMETMLPYDIQPQILALNVTSKRMAIKVNLKHPESNTIFRGFDVRGIVFTSCTDTSWDDADLILPKDGDNLYLRNPDGYTRWWNPSEFSTGGPNPLKQYVNGKHGHKYTGAGDYNYNGTVNPYKYFIQGDPDTFVPSDPFNVTNGLNLVTYFSDPANFAGSEDGSIPPDASCSRIYQFSFSDTFLSNFGFNYAIDGCWAPPAGTPPYELGDFPPYAHLPEPFLLDIRVDKNSLYYINENCQGGELSFLVDVWDWQNFGDSAYFGWNTPSEGNHGALRITGRNGFIAGSTPTVEFVSSDPAIRQLTYRVTYTNPPLQGAGIYNVMLIAEHALTYAPVFNAVDDIFIASYLPLSDPVIVLFFCPDFELPYHDPADNTTWGCWSFYEYNKTPNPYTIKTPQPALTDTNYYHWGLSESGESWSSQVHYVGGAQVQDMTKYANNMRNALVSPGMVFPASGAIKITLTHTFSTEPFDDFGDFAFVWGPPNNSDNYYALPFYRFAGTLPGNHSGIQDGSRKGVFYIDRLTKLSGTDVIVFNPAPGGVFHLAFFFDSNDSVNEPFLGWEIGQLDVEETLPWNDAQMSTVYTEHFDTDFPTQDMWQYVDAGTGGEYWGLTKYTYPGNDGTFLDAFADSSSCYWPGVNEEAVLTLDLPDSLQIMLRMRHRFYLDLGSYAFLAVNDIDGDDAGEEFLVPDPCYAGGLQPYFLMRDIVFSDTFQDAHNFAQGWGNSCWAAENTCGFDTVQAFDDQISSFFDLTPYAGQTVNLRFIFRSGPTCSCKVPLDCKTPKPFDWLVNYATWRIEEVTVKAS